VPDEIRRPRRRRRRLVLLGLLLVVLCVAWGGWQAVQGAQDLQVAKDRLAEARGQLAQTGDARLALDAAADRTEGARERFDDPIVRVLAAVPRLGDPLQSARGISTAADLTVREALLPLVDAAGPEPVEQLVQGAGRIDVDYLARLEAPADRARAAVREAADALDDAPANTGVGRVDEAREELDTELTELRGLVEDVALATGIAPDLLGRGGVRRYLVLSQSPAEARGTGGLLGGYTLLEAADGALRILRSGPRSELDSPGTPVVDLGAEYDQHYGQNGPTKGWINSNLSPHFPYAGQIWTALWERQYDEQLDGVLVVDPVALSYLLEATGPVTVGDGEQVAAGNVVDATLRDVYARFDNDPARDRYLQSVSTAVAAALTERDVPGRPLVDGLRRSVEEQRLRLWLTDPPLQQQIQARTISGSLPEGARAVGDVVVDSSGSKLNYYLDRQLAYTRGCGTPSRLVLTLTNGAPASGLPDYVTPERLRGGKPAGTSRLIVTLYLPAGSAPLRLTVDGKALPALRQGTERGLVWVEHSVELLPGQRQVLDLVFDEPAGDRPLQRVVQPLVRPEKLVAGGC
jgi:hypothetical protein